MPIRADYFVSNLVVELKLQVLVVAQNRLGCLNHIMLTVRSITQNGLHCLGGVLNDFSAAPNIASATNPEILEDSRSVAYWIGGRYDRVTARLEIDDRFGLGAAMLAK